VIWGSVALFAVAFGFLTSQLANGNDPTLSKHAAAQASPRRVLVRRVVKRRIVTQVVPAPGPTSVSGPVSTSAAPVVAAPAPAPVTTSAS
jgi:hypothetical protein